MDIAAFWELMDKTREASDGDPFKQADLLTEALTQLSENDILTYEAILWDLMDQTFTADLWDAAYIIGCGCGEGGFMDFRAWLIGQGKEVFEKALADPESLVEIVEVGQETQVGSLTYVASHAYERKTGGNDMPPRPRKRPELIGELHEEHEKVARFPKLAAKFWERCK